MTNNFVYTGKFQNDKFHGPNEQLLIPNMIIYKGEFI